MREGQWKPQPNKSIIKEVKEIKEVKAVAEVKEETQEKTRAHGAAEKVCYDASQRICIVR